jgi:guanylate kinase
MRLVESEKMIEWKKTIFGLYGTPLFPTQSYIMSGIPVIMDIDPQGFRKIKERNYSSVSGIYLLPPSLEILRYQLSIRGKERGIKSQKDIDLRYMDALESIRMAREYDMILVNESVAETAEIISRFINTLKIRDAKEDIFAEWVASNNFPLT